MTQICLVYLLIATFQLHCREYFFSFSLYILYFCYFEIIITAGKHLLKVTREVPKGSTNCDKELRSSVGYGFWHRNDKRLCRDQVRNAECREKKLM